MSIINVEPLGDIAVLRLQNGVTNAIDPDLVTACSQSLKAISQAYRGMVLTGGNKFFSIGLNLPELLKYDRKVLTRFWQDFDEMMIDLFTLPIPTVCAISGHAVAGGTILALACDFRYIASGKRFMGLNEVTIGVPVPYLADMMLRQIIGDGKATEMTYGGAMIDPDQAAVIGLVGEVVEEKNLLEKAVEKITPMAAYSQTAFQFIKQSRVGALVEHYQKTRDERLTSFLECWYQQDVQMLLQKAAEKF